MKENEKDEAQWLPSVLPFWELHSCGSYKCSEPWLERQTSTKLGPHDTIRKVLRLKCLKCPHIAHLDLIFMNYDQKKGRESNWEFDSRPQIPWKKGSNEVWLEHVILHWKYIFKGYKRFYLHSQDKLDWKRYECPKSWNNKSPSFGTFIWESWGKVTFVCSPHGEAHNIL